MDTTRTPGGTAANHDPQDVDGPATTDQLRGEIDAGRAGDKNAHTDPAAAPLGSDDEAAGRPATQDEIATARQEEVLREKYSRDKE
jgi:hypothetical protein